MKTVSFFFLLSLLSAPLAAAQETQPARPGIPVTISVFSHAVSLPTFRGFWRKPNLGVRVGTEFYYRNRTGSQLFQTLNVGYYYHRSLQSGLFLNSELGYRKFVGGFFAEGLVGIGALGLSNQLRSYEPTDDRGYRPASRLMVRLMPSFSAGVGYRFRRHTAMPVSVFTRYEMFGGTPFSNRGIPVLPHAAWHVGTRLYFSH